MRTITVFIRALIYLFFVCGITSAGHFKADTTINGLRVELHVLPAEPFFTKDQVSAGEAKEGMVIMNGAKPLPLDAQTKPTHHLVVHVFDSLTARAITNAKIKMSYLALDEKGEQSGSPVTVPVVVMQSIGKGEESTHYGNNVILRDGPYVVSVVVNGMKIKFKIDHLFEPTGPGGSVGPAKSFEPASSHEPAESRGYKLSH
jgi:hypothetical protein